MIITGATFTGRMGLTHNLSGFTFDGCTFADCNFASNWQGCTFQWCNFTDCHFDCDLQGATFDNCTFDWCDVTDAVVDCDTQFLDCNIHEVNGWNDLAVGCTVGSNWIEV